MAEQQPTEKPHRHRSCYNWRIFSTLLFLSTAKVSFGTSSSYSSDQHDYVRGDWLLRSNAGHPTRLVENICWDDDDGTCGMELSNGLLTRRWTLDQQPAFGTVNLLMTPPQYSNSRQQKRRRPPPQESMLRMIEPEATFSLTVNGRDATTYRVGDLIYKDDDDTFRAYLNRTHFDEKLARVPCHLDSTTFRYVSHNISEPKAPFQWTPGTRHSLDYASWPPKGLALNVHFRLQRQSQEDASSNTRNVADHLQVTMHYEMYDGIPVMAKWMSIERIGSDETAIQHFDNVKLSSVTVERLASFPPYGAYLLHGSQMPTDFTRPPPRLVSITDQAHGSKCAWYDDYDASNDTATSKETPHDMGASEPLLICNYTAGPGVQLSSGGSKLLHDTTDSTILFQSFRAILLATDSTDLDRHTLMRHRMTQTLIPHVTENPLFFHAVLGSDDTQAFRKVVDQMCEVGFEMLIYSFGSVFELETTNQTYVEVVKDQVDYAKSKGIEVGGYDLIVLERGHYGYGRNVSDEWTRLDADSGELTDDACFASGWYDRLSELTFAFIEKTGISMLETDGPYGGQSCSSTNHSHHQSLEDSVYQQTQLQNAFFLRLRNMGVYLNQPDSYFYSGGSRSGMGYDEQQYSLPRWRQLTMSRMGMYDDLYRFLPTQGWMFVPLTQYHSGGDGATFAHHPEALDWAVTQYLGAGTAACYRGPVVYNESAAEGEEIKSIWKRRINFYKAHRETLIQPVVHLRRPTMDGWDGYLHVHPLGKHEVGLAMIFNPTDRKLERTEIVLPLYYTSLTADVVVTVNDTAPFTIALERDYTIMLELDLPPKSIHSIIFERPGAGRDVQKVIK